MTRLLEEDQTHRYAPAAMLCHIDGLRPVVRWVVHQPDQHEASPIRNEYTAVECVLDTGKRRWFGCDRAYINSELRMVVVGHNPRDEVRAKWQPVPPDCTDQPKTEDCDDD